LQLLGPAYLASFIDFVVIVGSEGLLEEASYTHPSPRLRICLMREVLENKGIGAYFTEPMPFDSGGDGTLGELGYFYYQLFEERARAEREFLGPMKLQPSHKFPIDIRSFWENLEDHLQEFIPPNQRVKAFEPKKFQYLLDRLRAGTPIGSYSPFQVESGNEQAVASIAAIEELLATGRDEREAIKKKLSIIQDRVKESPCTVAEIMNAGWLFKCQEVYMSLVCDESFIDSDVWDEQESRLRDKLFSQDRLLRNSIETSHLHSLLSKEYGND
jgi:hypothetical protein